MAGKPIRGRLMQYAEEHAGKSMFVAKIAADLREDQQRVRKGLANTASSLPDWGLERITQDCWRYTPPEHQATHVGPKKGTLFSLLAQLQNGDLLLDAEDGALFRAGPL